VLSTPELSGLEKAAAAAVALRLTHPHVPAMDVLDLVMQSVNAGDRSARMLMACEVISSGPPAAFGLPVAEAFDTAMTREEWLAFTGAAAMPELAQACVGVWRAEVLPRFVARYESQDSGCTAPAA
jgi:hypothetical protein